ncbi:glycosyltransferase family 4 protein [Croceicoccus sp. F390]|uniref:Glycosyltransferase family 4 protein n=1 Tax=Croceicoccus esteveae TaxID=3075597 RepID=A0ABU2ZGX1_9SPHN|nr:glycosyltransferase family 4 protein [Croceicoccus sp. F390]MDT0575845.1 glycosyltransferase family 4 protein [Croceicoccus sp. F390]
MTADAVGGVWQYALELAEQLITCGNRVTLAVLGPDPDVIQETAARRVRSLRLMKTGCALDWMCSEAAPVADAAAKIAGLAADLGADIVHCNTPALAGAAVFPMPVVAVAHGCLATWWQAAYGGTPAPQFDWHRQMMRRGLIAADAVVAPSAAFAADVQAAYRLPCLPLVVHNGRTPPAALAGPADRAGQAGQLDAALTVGRHWDKVKNTALLDAVAGRISVPFLCAGALQSANGECLAPRHLQTLGQVDALELAALLAQRPVFVSAARFEPFGLAVLEAAQAQCPLILSNIATFRELWDGAALFLDADDEQGFAATVTALITDPSRREELGTAAADRAARFTPHAMAQGMQRTYAKLLKGEEAAA